VAEVIVVEGLEKSYGTHRAVDDLSFAVGEGEIVALLGPNGAGKTTTIEILEGLLRADAGKVRILGHDPSQRDRWLADRIGVVPQQAGIDEVLSVVEHLRLHASLYRRRRNVAAVIDETGLSGFERTRLGELSGGIRRRVDLALALVGDPQVLFLDEPTTGLDPAARRSTWSTVASLKARGVAVLLTSHYLEEVQVLADRVVMIRNGRLVANDTPGHIVGDADRVTLISFRLPVGVDLPSGVWEVLPPQSGEVLLASDEPADALRELLAWATASSIDLDDLQVRRPSLEDRYLELTSET
jgi:ABC-2 type transport system ATP-binding protein